MKNFKIYGGSYSFQLLEKIGHGEQWQRIDAETTAGGPRLTSKCFVANPVSRKKIIAAFNELNCKSEFGDEESNVG